MVVIVVEDVAKPEGKGFGFIRIPPSPTVMSCGCQPVIETTDVSRLSAVGEELEHIEGVEPPPASLIERS